LVLERIGSERLLITLSDEDLNALNINFMNFDWNDNYTQNVLKKLLLLARIRTGFNEENQQLMIEIMVQDENCLVMATRVQNNVTQERILNSKNAVTSEPYIFAFENLENLMCAVERLFNKGLTDVHSQILYKNEEYYLIFYTKNELFKEVFLILNEYGNLKSKGLIGCARLNETGRILIKDGAIEKLGKYFKK